MVDQPEPAPARITCFSQYGDESDADIDLGLKLSFNAETRKHREEDVRKKMKVSMGFTFMQRQELERQAYIFKYIDSGVEVPYQLLYPILKSFAHCGHFPFIPNLFGSPFTLRLNGSMDTEPGRCKRTDGKKWRCANESMPDYKYCKKHLHRGRRGSTEVGESSMKLSSASSAEIYANVRVRFPISETVSPLTSMPADQ